MKNFKRVISAVIALALSASTLVAVSAAKFTDVDNTNYAEAIDVLSALDIVHGYEDGSFKPDGEITRAEAAVMIVGALNMNADANAAAGSSKFTDVNEKASWATGFVNVGVAQGYINGMDATTFAPQENVTYAQMCVMLTKITGYGDYAETYGGWPTGYTTMAASSGINKGVAVSNDTPLKRGQVAQMLYNAITTPVLGISEYRLDGNSYKKLDGTGSNEYKSILSDKFEGFEVKATVDSFPAAGEVKLTNVTSDYKAATDADRFFSTKPTASTTGTINKAIIENGIDLSTAIQQQVRAILYVDNNDKVHLVFATQTDAVETKEVAADDYESIDFVANQKIKFGSTKYNFANSVNVYVNGDLYATFTGATGDDAAIETIIEAATGNVKLAKVAANATNYDTIFVDAYVMGQVTNVSYKNEVTTIKFSPASNNLGSYKKIEIADNDIDTDSVKVAVTLDGKAIELKDLQENDIIAVKTKITGTNTIDQSNENITVLVSRDTIAGRVTSIDASTGENAFVIEGTEYAAVDKANVGLAVGEKYNKIYLDSFGRVYGYDDEAVEDTTKYAILAKVTDKTDLILVLPDGTRKTYEAKNDTIYAAGTKALEISGTAPTNVTTGTVLNAVVEYTVKSGQINSITPVTGVAFNGPYKESVGKVQTVGISDASGVVVAKDGDSYKDYTSVKASDFIDEEVYAGAGFGKIGTTSNYSLVVVTSAGFDFGANSRFAVVNTDGFSKGLDADGDEVDQLKVLVNGEKTTLDFAPDAKKAYGTPSLGDVFFYTVDSDGLVDGTKKITRTSISETGTINLATLFGSTSYNKTKWGNTLAGTEDIKLVKGLVVKTGTNSVSLLATPAATDAPVDFDAFETFSLADNCVIYTYDTDSEVADKNKLDEEGTLVATSYKDWTITEAPVATSAEEFTDANSNGKYDSGEKFKDENGNDKWDDAVAIPAGYSTASIGQIAWGFTPSIPADLAARGIKTSKFDTLEGETAAGNAQYALALIVDDKVVEIYEILQ